MSAEFAVWGVTLIAYVIAWRWLQKRRWYFVVASILCLTPVVVVYPGTYYMVFPFVGGIPAYIIPDPASLEIFVFYVVPPAGVVGLISWFIYPVLVRRLGKYKQH